MNGHNILIVFFSMTRDYSFGSTERLVKGHTEQVADHIAEVTGGYLYRINPVEALKKEREYRPEPLRDFEKYDAVYLGFPIYYHTMPALVREFVRSHNFDGKVIVPFTTHAGSGLGRSVAELTYMCPGAAVKPGKAIGSAQVQIEKENIQKWALDSLK